MQDLREQLPGSVPMWAVDTACLYPMQLTARAPAKAYIFRSGTDKPRRERLAQMPYSSGSRNWANFLASCRVCSIYHGTPASKQIHMGKLYLQSIFYSRSWRSTQARMWLGSVAAAQFAGVVCSWAEPLEALSVGREASHAARV